MDLTNKQKLAIELLAHSKLKKTFYWTGGTLLSYYYLHHRKSLDLDFFTQSPFSLDDIAANKTMAYFDRVEPKDLFDIYFLIHKGGFSPKELLGLVQQKFGLSLDEPSFWSESFKSLKLLDELKPLLLEKEDISEKLLKTIGDYFRNGSSEYLRQNLE